MKIPKILSQKIKEKYNISRNTFIRKDKGKKAEEREVEIGDIHSDIFQPQVKLKQWENETNFSARLIDDEPDTPKIKTSGNEIKFLKNKLEAHFYETKTDKKTDAFEFEVVLKEKPKTNKVRMSIRTKGLKFCYQPPLNEEKQGKRVVRCTATDCYDKDGKVICHRPENVVGSYAVYHESKAGDYSKMGLKNYRCGKAFHIYRPKIIDSKGNWVWGKLNINEKKELLTVEIPQEFLDKAVYPVIADPTFGYDTVGGSSYYPCEDGEGVNFTSPSDISGATIESMSFYVSGGDSDVSIKGTIHEQNDGSSNISLISNGVTNAEIVETNFDGWKTCAFSSSPSLQNNTVYFLSHIQNNCLGHAKYDTDTDVFAEQWIGDFSSPGDIGEYDHYGDDDKKRSIYCTYGVPRFVCTIKESGGDYSSLSAWEDAIECDLTSAATKAYSGSKTGTVSDGDSVTLYRDGSSQGVTATCLHATSSQILVKDISNTSFSFQSGDQWRVDSSNYFQISDIGASPSAVAKIDGTWTNADTSAVTIDGWTTDADHYIKIYTTPEARHDGKWNTNKYRLETSDVDCITNYENYVIIDGLQIKLTTSTEQYAVWMRPGGTSEIRISNNIIRGVVSGGSYVTGINFWNSASGTVGKIWNNIIYGFKGDSTRVGISDWEADATLYIYNNTISDCYKGIYRYAGTLTAVNNAVFNNVDDFDGTFSTCDYNASDDGDGTNSVDISPGASESDDWNDAFVDYANGDFHIKDTDSVLYNAGTNDPGSGLFSDDIDGDTRDDNWDIGADEYVAGGGAAFIPKVMFF